MSFISAALVFERVRKRWVIRWRPTGTSIRTEDSGVIVGSKIKRKRTLTSECFEHALATAKVIMIWQRAGQRSLAFELMAWHNRDGNEPPGEFRRFQVRVD
ncbi:hypothetical protein [Roseibium sp. ROS1]